ncbi:MAG TPA: hypothetical protein V6D17_14820, partial [Candidatus Obscuribacterales bacterium]
MGGERNPQNDPSRVEPMAKSIEAYTRGDKVNEAGIDALLRNNRISSDAELLNQLADSLEQKKVLPKLALHFGERVGDQLMGPNGQMDRTKMEQFADQTSP